ncbi:MAG: DUF5943 domain-containing protein [Parvibaculaceae bacterium]|nr:DUF5943 domain-containing protein [Parvibaculaceae bacterium]
MAMPEVPIDVDSDTGIWRTDGLPMVYLPRHFLVNNHRATEAALGIEPYRAMLRGATDKSAVHWCEVESRTHGFSPLDTFHHYFRRLSQRGWGRFTVESLDIAKKRGIITLENSIFALEYGPQENRCVCYMFEGFMTGAFRYLLGSGPQIAPSGLAEAGVHVGCAEMECAADGSHDRCRFVFGEGLE